MNLLEIKDLYFSFLKGKNNIKPVTKIFSGDGESIMSHHFFPSLPAAKKPLNYSEYLKKITKLSYDIIPVLNNKNLKIRPGEKIGIAGPS